MKQMLRVIVVLNILATAGSLLPASQALQPGFHKQEVKLKDGSMLRNGLYIPPKLDDAGKIPLIIALHYGGTVTPYYGLDYMKLLVEPAFRQFGAIIAAPDCPFQNWRSERSESAVIELIEYLKGAYAIDNRRIAVIGFSMGGMGTWRLIARHPDLFSAAIIMSGKSEPTDLEGTLSTPVYIIHSDIDAVISPANARKSYAILKKKGVPVKLAIIPGIGHYQTKAFIPALETARKWLRKRWR